jgi:hypothetical protein
MKGVTVGHILRLHAAVLGFLVATAMPAFATDPLPLPEINGGSLTTGLGLLAGSVVWLRTRRKST